MRRVFLAAAIGSLLGWYGFWLARPINMVTADLGRHLVSGRELLASGRGGLWWSNYYSYTYPDFPVVNHHWGSGLLFFAVESAGGILGVHLFFMGVSLAALLVFLMAALAQAGIAAVWLTAVVLMPLISARVEVRPEVFSYLLAGVYYLLLVRYRAGRLRGRWLGGLPLLQVVWVNLHVYFIFGWFIVGAFWLEAAVRGAWLWRRERRLSAATLRLSAVLGLTVLASLVSPFGLRGVIYPFTIFGNYGYRLVENQSVRWLEQWGMEQPNFGLVKVVGVTLALLLVAGWVRRRPLPLPEVLLVTASGVMAWLAIRNFTLFGLLALPAAARAWQVVGHGVGRYLEPDQRRAAVVLAAAGAVLFVYFQQFEAIAAQRRVLGVGLAPGVAGAARFLLAHGLSGPVLNNYDNGGYLIYYLFPAERVFVDNRPEAYPAAFFEQVYIPLQQEERVWHEQLARYNFQLVVWSHRDLTNWGQEFLAARLEDPDWRLVYADAYQVVLVRNTLEMQRRFPVPMQATVR